MPRVHSVSSLESPDSVKNNKKDKNNQSSFMKFIHQNNKKKDPNMFKYGRNISPTPTKTHRDSLDELFKN